jgi:phage tail-like protein
MSGRREAYGAYFFEVTLTIGGSAGTYFFRSCSGLKSESEIQELAEGGLNSTTHKLMGRTKFPNIILKQGYSNNDLFDKRKPFVKEGAGKRFSGTIKQLGPGGKVVGQWDFNNAWICKWEGPDFDAGKNEISIETIEIAHEGLNDSCSDH